MNLNALEYSVLVNVASSHSAPASATPQAVVDNARKLASCIAAADNSKVEIWDNIE